MEVGKVLRQCRFSKRYRGYMELEKCIRIVVEDEDNLLYLKGIYHKVAEEFHVSWSSVERNIRTMVDHSWENGGKEQFEILAGGAFYDKPTAGEVIEVLACYVKEHRD